MTQATETLPRFLQKAISDGTLRKPGGDWDQDRNWVIPIINEPNNGSDRLNKEFIPAWVIISFRHAPDGERIWFINEHVSRVYVPHDWDGSTYFLRTIEEGGMWDSGPCEQEKASCWIRLATKEELDRYDFLSNEFPPQENA